MTKAQLITAVAKESQITRERAAIVVNTMFRQIVQAMLREERIEIRNFGNFVVKHYSGYVGRNPRSGEKVQVKSKRLPFFKAGLGLKKMLNQKG